MGGNKISASGVSQKFLKQKKERKKKREKKVDVAHASRLDQNQVSFSFGPSELKQMGLNHSVAKQNKLSLAFYHPD